MSDESVEIETHAEVSNTKAAPSQYQVDPHAEEGQDHFDGQDEGLKVTKKKRGRLGGLLRRLSTLSLFTRPSQQQRRTFSWRRKSEGASKSPSSPSSSFRALLVLQHVSQSWYILTQIPDHK